MASFIRVMSLYAVIGIVLFTGRIYARLQISFDPQLDTENTTESAPSIVINIFNNVTEYVCLDLADLVRLRIFEKTTLGGVTWAMDLLNVGDNFTNFGEARWNKWTIDQREGAVVEERTVPAPMQINVYGESGCQHEQHPWLSYSCQGTVLQTEARAGEPSAFPWSRTM
ncbi:hypothetical protein LTR37_001656 [Vermiconidia calcicola]|uniref:Uncharacterized protein n=1 Tax=Vermiconidia calcicola TaxID=1690605 RepID=A0ACC3NWU2_9PEZI|nr:hypothetical protein LTR37_001656 [Vermiconidia calcicola]